MDKLSLEEDKNNLAGLNIKEVTGAHHYVTSKLFDDLANYASANMVIDDAEKKPNKLKRPGHFPPETVNAWIKNTEALHKGRKEDLFSG